MTPEEIAASQERSRQLAIAAGMGVQVSQGNAPAVTPGAGTFGTTPPTTPRDGAPTHIDADGNRVDANGAIVTTAAELAALAAKNPNATAPGGGFVATDPHAGWTTTSPLYPGFALSNPDYRYDPQGNVVNIKTDELVQPAATTLKNYKDAKGLTDAMYEQVQKGGGLGADVPGLGGDGGAASSAAIDAATARAAGLSDQFNNQYLNYQDRAAPVAQSQQIGSVVNADAQAPIQAGQSTAAQIANTIQAQTQAPIQAQQIGTVLTPQQQAIMAQQIQAAQAARTTLGPTAQATGATIAPTATATPTQLAPAAMANAANIDQTQQAQFRADQRGLVTGLQGAIAGTDPSVAAIMLRQATERNQANQFAQAAAANGMNAGLAQRQAMIGAADINQQSIGQQALLRAQEIATARGQLGGVLDSGRNTDVGLATGQAGLNQQTNIANQAATNTTNIQQGQLDVQTKLANAGFVNTQNMTQAQLQQALSLANAGFKNTATTTQAQLDAETARLNATQQNAVAQANQGASLDASKTNATLAQGAALANAAAQNATAQANQSANLAAGTSNATLGQQVALANAAAGNQTNTTNANLANTTGIANANNVTGANTASSQLANAVALANAAAGNQVNQTNAQLGTQTNIANAGNATTTAGQNISAQNNLAQNALAGSGQAIQGTVGAANAEAERAKAQATQNAAIAGGAASTLGVLLSDRRAKTDIADGGMDVGKFLDDLKAYGFRYKDPDAPGAAPGRRTGIMVQDLEKSPLGRSLVRETPAGKAVDVNQATGAALAALAHLNSRLTKVEGRA